MKPTTHIDFGIRGDTLQLNSITRMLGINPTGGFNPSDPYLGKEKFGDEIRTVVTQRPAFGVWHFNTEGLITSPLLQDHAEFLLAKLESCEQAIKELMQSGIYHIQMSFWHVGPAGFDLQSATMARLAKLCNRMCFTFFEVSEPE